MSKEVNANTEIYLQKPGHASVLKSLKLYLNI